MNEYKILIDSTSDLPDEYIKKNNLAYVPLTYTIDGVDYNPKTNLNLSAKEFYDKLREGKTSKTSMVSVETFVDTFKSILEEKNDILYIAFSSGLSGTYGSAIIAKDELKEMYPDNKIIVIDSLSASLGLGLLINYAVSLKDNGKSIEEVTQIIENKKLNFCHYFTVDDLNHLYRGGRVSKTSAFFGTLLGIKPVMYVDNEGKLIPIGKVRGRRQALDNIVEKLLSKLILDENDIIYISHGDCTDDAKYVQEKLQEKTKIKSYLINDVGPTIGTHSGPATVAVFGFGTDRNEKALK